MRARFLAACVAVCIDTLQREKKDGTILRRKNKRVNLNPEFILVVIYYEAFMQKNGKYYVFNIW